MVNHLSMSAKSCPRHLERTTLSKQSYPEGLERSRIQVLCQGSTLLRIGGCHRELLFVSSHIVSFVSKHEGSDLAEDFGFHHDVRQL